MAKRNLVIRWNGSSTDGFWQSVSIPRRKRNSFVSKLLREEAKVEDKKRDGYWFSLEIDTPN